MKKPSPLVYVEIEESWRWSGSEPSCCFLTVVEQRSTMHRRVAHTEHVSGSGVTLFDEVTSRVNDLRREYILTMMQPF
jgi:hypothetical protein